MKKIIFCTMLLVIAATSFSQDYLKKSKSQKTAAWIMLGGGTSLMIIGIASISAENTVNYIFGGDQSGFNTAMILFYTGVLSAVGSIPFFIASGRNKHKAMAATAFFKMETIPLIQHATIVSQSYPAVSIKINLK